MSTPYTPNPDKTTSVSRAPIGSIETLYPAPIILLSKDTAARRRGFDLRGRRSASGHTLPIGASETIG